MDRVVGAFRSQHASDTAEIPFTIANVPTITKPQAFYRTRARRKSVGLSDLSSLRDESGRAPETVLVVENIDPEWMRELERSHAVDPAFFAGHASNPKASSSWEAVFGRTPTDRHPPATQKSDGGNAFHWHLDGAFSHGSSAQTMLRRRNFFDRLPSTCDPPWEIFTYTRLSCWRRKGFSIILIDISPICSTNAPFPHAPTELHLPVSNNRGGLVVPRTDICEGFSLRECLDQFLSHPWHFNVIFSQSNHIIRHDVLVYLISTSTWTSKQRSLDREIKQTSFNNLHNPNASVNNLLIYQRQELDTLIQRLQTIRRCIPEHVVKELGSIRSAICADSRNAFVADPAQEVDILLDRARILEKFLIDSFSLLIGSTSVLRAEESVRQGQRTHRLTVLALLYVPLSFSTSVFGMNIKEINGSPLSVWVVTLFLLATVMLTLGMIAGYLGWEKRLVRTATIPQTV